MARQLIFDLTSAPSYDRDDFLVSGSNSDACAMIEAWPRWPDRTLLLLGPTGAGKSHLGTIWAGIAAARIVTARDTLDPSGWAAPVVAFVEDYDRADHTERALFHLINLVRETEGWLLLTARTSPQVWGIETPDLLSRLRLATVTTIGPPDAKLIRAVIVKLFADRQIHIDDDVVSYAAFHCEQSLEAVNRFVAAVDEESLASGRRITRHLAARSIAALGDETP